MDGYRGERGWHDSRHSATATAWDDQRQRSHAAAAADAAAVATAAARKAAKAAAAAADMSRYERYPNAGTTDMRYERYPDRDLHARYATDRDLHTRYGTRELSYRPRSTRPERNPRDYARDSTRDYARSGSRLTSGDRDEYSASLGNLDRSFAVRVMIISSNLSDEMVLMRAVHDNCALVVYDYNRETLEGLLRRVQQVLNGSRADSIALIDHGRPQEFCLLRDMKVNTDTISSMPNLRAFFQDLGSLIKSNGRLDLLSCNLASHGNTALLSRLEDVVNRDIAASNDLTGREGDFELEVGGDHGPVNAGRLYFDTDLLHLWRESAACTQEELADYEAYNWN